MLSNFPVSRQVRMQQSSVRMRLLERRFFMKLDDKKTNSIANVSELLKSTHQEIMSTIQALQKAKDSLLHAEVALSCGLSAFAQIISLLDVPRKTTESLSALLGCSVIDYKRQHWEEMTAPALEMMNRVGPLARSKNTALTDGGTMDQEPFNFDRFKRHLNSLIERCCRMVAADSRSNAEIEESMDNIADEPLKEEDDEHIAADSNRAEEDSEWTCDVQQTMDLLPRL